MDTSLPAPHLKTVKKDEVSGTVANIDGTVPTGKVQLCVDGLERGDPATVDAKGSFTITGLTLQVGQPLKAKFLPPKAGAIQSYSVDSNSMFAGTCSQDTTAGTSMPAPTLNIAINPNGARVFSGSVNKVSTGHVRICVNDLPAIDSAGKLVEADLTKDGTFSVTAKVELGDGDKVTAQAHDSADPPSYGKVTTAPIPMIANPAQTSSPDRPTNVLAIAGLEEAGYSSLDQNSDAFVNLSISGPSNNRLAGWGRARLLSAPQPSTQGIVSVFTDPSGQLTSLDYTKVGQALDFVAGAELKLGRHLDDLPGKLRWSIIGGFGVTTPLNSQTVALTYVAPPPGSLECATLVNRFSAKNGYTPGLTQAPSGSSTCLAGGYTDVSFSNRDRSSFLLKYGAGFRSINAINTNCAQSDKNCTPSTGLIDITFGQDESVTRGILRHVVFKMDGMVPIPTGSASFLYIFGSAYIRIAKNQDYSPLILQSASGVTIPSSTVIVLPLQQPDRDFYRLGVGLNINQIFCKITNTDCGSKTPTVDSGSKSTGTASASSGK